jgi:hypothetical protein
VRTGYVYARQCPYIEVAAPLLSFHALDFAVNKDAAKVKMMWHRAWRETAKQFALAKAKGWAATRQRPL